VKFARRLDQVPPYLFAELERKIAEKQRAGIDVISLGIGDPDLPTPEPVVAALAEAAGLLVAPHTWTHGIGLLANLHLVASIPNHSWFEFPHEPPGWPASALSQMLTSRPWIDPDGCLALPDRPGFGFELDEELIERHTVARYG